MAEVLSCPSSLVAYFSPTIYKSMGSSQVLPDLLKGVDAEKVSCVQFLPNGVAGITFATTEDCDRAVNAGIKFRDTALKVAPVEVRSRLVYLRDCPTEVPQSAIMRTFAPFGEVHVITNSTHEGYPSLHDGTRVIKISLAKDIPSVVRVAGFDCRVWYRRQPPFCPICRQSGHRVRDCPYHGVCRRCRRPGHHARDCRNACSYCWRPPPPPPAATASPEEETFVSSKEVVSLVSG